MKVMAVAIMILSLLSSVFIGVSDANKLTILSMVDKGSSAGNLVDFLGRIAGMDNHINVNIKYVSSEEKKNVFESLFAPPKSANPIVVMDMSSFPLLLSNKSFNISDLTYVSLVAMDPYAIVTRKDFSWKNIAQFMEAGKKVDNRVTIGVSEDGVSGILGRAVEKLSGIKFLLVYIQSVKSRISSIMSGKIGTAIVPVSWIYPRVHKFSKLRILAIVGNKRIPVLPNIPSLKEAGIKALPNGNTVFIVGNRDMGSPELGRIRRVLSTTYCDSEWQSFCRSKGYQPLKLTHTGGFTYIRSEFLKVKKILLSK